MENRDDTDIKKAPAKPACWPLRISLMVWMFSVMFLALLLFRGPVISSIVKRVSWARVIYDAVAAFFGAA